MSFASLGLSEQLLQTLQEKGYTTPTPIQSQAIPAILAGRDLLAAAQTGTGKTAGFTLPLLQRLSTGTPVASNRVRVLVLAPTRELAIQVGASVAQYNVRLRLKTTVVYGGVAINPQMMKLRRGADVLVATPGRLFDLYEKNAFQFDDLEALVLDEADRMLDMGFITDIRKIMALLPAKRQSLLFSATFSPEIRELAKSLLRDPLEIDISPRNAAADTVQQWLHPVDKKRKAELLSHLIRTRDWRQVLVFTRTKIGADKLVADLGRDGIRAASIHSGKSQGWRAKALSDFKKGKVSILVATDVAARGLDIDQLPLVVNFNLPLSPEDYVHRIGRTGRAGSKGRAISLVCADEVVELRAIERLLKKKLTRDEINGFEPEHVVPASPEPNAPQKKAKKPKKHKKKEFKAAVKAGKANRNGKPKNGKGKDAKARDSKTRDAKTKDTKGNDASNKDAKRGERPAQGAQDNNPQRPPRAGAKPQRRDSSAPARDAGGKAGERPRQDTPTRSERGQSADARNPNADTRSGRPKRNDAGNTPPPRRPRVRPAGASKHDSNR